MDRLSLIRAAIVAVFAVTAVASPQPGPTALCGPFSGTSTAGAGGSSARTLAEGVTAEVVYARSGALTYGFAVVFRGLRGGSGGGGSSSGTASAQTKGYITRSGTRVVEYDIGPDSSVARIGGVRIDLTRDGNVLLADFPVDRSQPPTVSVPGCVDISKSDALTVVGSMPRVKAFIGPDGRTRNRMFEFAELITSGRLLIALAVLALLSLILGHRRKSSSAGTSARAPTIALSSALALTVATAVMLVPTVLENSRGPEAPIALMLPVALAAAPFAFRHPLARAVTCAVAGLFMAAFCAVGALSIGLLFVPATLTMFVAALIGLLTSLWSSARRRSP